MRRKRPENQAEEELIQSQRKMLTALAVMAAVLVSAILIARLSWSLQERRQAGSPSPDSGRPEQIKRAGTPADISSDTGLSEDVQIETTPTLEPGEPSALRALAFIEASRGEYELALRHLQQALETAPDWPGLHMDAAATCALSGQNDIALEYLRSALALSSPGAVYRTFRQPAFEELRRSEAGRAFERELAQAARDMLQNEQETQPAHTFPAVEHSVELITP